MTHHDLKKATREMDAAKKASIVPSAPKRISRKVSTIETPAIDANAPPDKHTVIVTEWLMPDGTIRTTKLKRLVR